VRNHNEGGLADLRLYEHHAIGRLLRVTVRTEDGGKRVAARYEHDTASRKKKTQTADPLARRPSTHYVWNVDSIENVSRSGARIRYDHDARELDPENCGKLWPADR
jgi:hypothetical protein